MNWITIVWVCTLLIAIGLVFVGSFFIDRMLDKRRRTKHPKYFELYDAGLKMCFETSDKVNKEAEYLGYHFNLLTEGLQDGECTEEYFRSRFEELANRHVKVSLWRKERQVEIEKLFREADRYAKENNLGWGVLY